MSELGQKPELSGKNRFWRIGDIRRSADVSQVP
jgi:hypothetical protein